MNALLLSVGLLLAARPYTIDDQVALRRLSTIRVSPDGKQLVLAVRDTDLEKNRGRVDLWLINDDGTGLRQLTSHPENDSEPAWSPDGRSIYFLSSRGGSSQVWRLSLDGGEPTQITKSPLDVESFKLSRDGRLLAFSAETFPDCDSLECTQKRLDEKGKQKATGRLYEALLYRHWDSWRDGRRSHLFVQPVAGGTPVDVMKKMQADAPTRPFGGSEEYTFSPDNKQLVFSARDAGRAEAWSTDVDLFAAPVDGSKPPKKLTTENRATDTQPVFSPDGKRLAYLAMKRPGYEADQLTVMVRDWPEGKDRPLTSGWDRSADSITFSPNGATIFVTAQHVGQKGVFAIDAASGQVREVHAQGNVSDVQVSGERLFFAKDTLKAPAELFRLDPGQAAPKQLTTLNPMEGLSLGDFEQFSFKGANGETVYGYLVKPVGFEPKKKYPLAFLIHGGPQGSFGNHWHYRWNPQVYAGRGYAAVMIDFHGSTGYGQAFTDAIRLDWGGKPLEDLQKGLAAALAKYPFIDGGRACALGASYGGFMINWMAGVWSEPWKCLVNHDGNLDEAFAYYDTEELWFPEWEHGGLPWENPEAYAKHNPIAHVSKWKVPMLVVAGGRDYRVVDTQAMATFTALQRRGVPSQFLHFPDENHWVLKPANSVLWHNTVLSWLDRWTKRP